MPGYSATPLAKKLGIKDGFKAVLLEVPADVQKELKEEFAGCSVPVGARADIDFALLFSKSGAHLNKEFSKVERRLAPAGMLWIGWPKKSSGVPTDLDENKVREIGLDAGLVDVKVCAITDVWSGLKFVRRIKDR